MGMPLLRDESPPLVLFTIQREVNRLVEKFREGLLEARDETDVRWLHHHVVQRLNTLFNNFSMLRQDMALIKLEALETIEREFMLGHVAAVQRTIKWRNALVDRYFPK